MSEDRSLLDEFIAESREHLETVEEDFILLEKCRQDPDPELVNKIFRAMHTIKGSAGFFGLKNISTLSHAMETLLAMIRDGELRLESVHIDALLEGIDKISAMIDDVGHSNEMPIEEINEKITSLIHRDVSGAVKAKLATKVEVVAKPGGTATQFGISSYDIDALPTEYRYFYVLTYELADFEQTTGKSPVGLVHELLLTGWVLDGYLEGGEEDLRKGVPHQGLRYVALYATVMDPDLIGTAVGLPDAAIHQVTREELVGAEEAKASVSSPPPQVSAVGQPSEPTSATALPAEGRSKAAPPPQAASESVRIRVDLLDRLMMLAGELVLVRNQHLTTARHADPVSRRISQRLDIVTSELQETIMRTRMQPIGNVFGKFSRIVRDLGKKLGKEIELVTGGNEVELDKAILEALADPLTHLIRNCCDHGIESPDERTEFGKRPAGTIHLTAYHEGGQINVRISDDGRGIDAEAVKRKVLAKGLKTVEEIERMGPKEVLSLIFIPGLSTAEQLSDVSGRGVGMDVVKTGIEKLGGMVEIDSMLGRGTDIYLRLPLTLAIIPSLIVKMGELRYAIPQMNLEELVCLYDDDVRNKIECAGSRELYRLRDHLLPMVHMREVLDRPEPFTEEVRMQIVERRREEREESYRRRHGGDGLAGHENRSLSFAVLRVGATRYGLIIDTVMGTEEIVVKPMHRAIKNLGIYSGATVLGDGQVALILDALGIARHAGIEFVERSEAEAPPAEHSADRASLLLFTSGPDEQFAVETHAVKRVEKVDFASVEHMGGKEYIAIDGEPTRVLRLDRQMGVSPCVEREEMYLLLPKGSPQPCGVLASRLVDVGSYSVDLNTGSFRDPAVRGSGLVRGHMTLLLDIDGLIRAAEPGWFAEGQVA